MNSSGPATNSVSVYAFLEGGGNGKTEEGSGPDIHALGPNVRAHRRHFLQQSQYTICTVRQGNELVYAKHEDVVARKEIGEDLLWKINIPVNARVEFLHELHKMNINFFSLFASEDSLLQTLATNIFLLPNRFNAPCSSTI
jgi:hypothetical protein